MKKFILFSIAILAIFTLMSAGCEGEITKPTADMELQKKTEKSMQEASKQVGMPGIVNFQELKMLKELYELRDQENLICHAYLVNEINGKVGQYLGKCLGYGLPYSTQFSNPEKIVENRTFTNADQYLVNYHSQNLMDYLCLPDYLLHGY